MGGGGTTVSPEFTGGSTGDMINDWGDNNGSKMVMVNGGKIVGGVVAGVVTVALIAGVTTWLIHQA